MSASETFLDGKVTLHGGDCIDVLKSLPADSIDAIVTDPPYHLTANKKGGTGVASVNLDSPYGRSRIGTGNGVGGFMGKQWDGGDIAFRVELWAEVLRVLKPGGHCAAFSGTRTYHRMAIAIEDAGFEIRDQIGWAFGQGFPKSLDVSKALDKRGGYGAAEFARAFPDQSVAKGVEYEREDKGSPVSDDARRWQGWGTALKPAWEPICLARKPLIGTVAENVMKHGTGALNIDGCRVATADDMNRGIRKTALGMMNDDAWQPKEVAAPGSALGRWPANIIHDGSDEVVAAFPDAPGQQADISIDAPSAKTGSIYGKMNRHGEKSADQRYTDKGSTDFAALPGMRRNDSGSAARFFYTAKADAMDRLGSKHPTVKPLDLMQWLVRLVTPPGGLVLDPFAGTGTTGEAAWREGFRAVLIEREAEYQDDIRRRMAHALAGPDERKRAIAKEQSKNKPVDAGPLFSGSDTPPAGRSTQDTRANSTSAQPTNHRPGRTEVVTP